MYRCLCKFLGYDGKLSIVRYEMFVIAGRRREREWRATAVTPSSSAPFLCPTTADGQLCAKRSIRRSLFPNEICTNSVQC
ncbi:hypothetical protein K1T71_003901 [Dendrolimus kikuchii]|uniref:Uncharacterized protein n=1 Tax=Dendrolimus kikuchii TaxID=765133 RepID=A0ACC1D9G0_9NEOP|nr:hypothetical protein K1T71_003901 [Dendrolimus kikuchii]